MLRELFLSPTGEWSTAVFLVFSFLHKQYREHVLQDFEQKLHLFTYTNPAIVYVNPSSNSMSLPANRKGITDMTCRFQPSKALVYSASCRHPAHHKNRAAGHTPLAKDIALPGPLSLRDFRTNAILSGIAASSLADSQPDHVPGSRLLCHNRKHSAMAVWRHLLRRLLWL